MRCSFLCTAPRSQARQSPSAGVCPKMGDALLKAKGVTGKKIFTLDLCLSHWRRGKRDQMFLGSIPINFEHNSLPEIARADLKLQPPCKSSVIWAMLLRSTCPGRNDDKAFYLNVGWPRPLQMSRKTDDHFTTNYRDPTRNLKGAMVLISDVCAVGSFHPSWSFCKVFADVPPRIDT